MTSVDPHEPHCDPTEWARLIERLEVPVILVVIASWMGERLRSDCSAEDVWQDTLVMAWRDRTSHRWTGLHAFRAWLLGIARHRLHDRLDVLAAQKRGGGRGALPLSSLAGADAGSTGGADDLLPPRTTTPSRMASALERAAILQEALGTLPDDVRELVRLRLFEELPMADVATHLGLALSTAYDRFLRGAAQYQRELERRLGSLPGTP